MVGGKKAKKSPLPVSAVDTMNKGKDKLPPFPVVQVQLVCVWALLTACVMAGSCIYNMAHQNDPAPNEPDSMSPWVTTIQLTGAEAVEVSSINGGQLWCSAPQAAAAVMALLLPAGRPRIRLALVALGATAVNHYLYARLLGLLFVSAPGNVTVTVETVAVFVSGVFDVLGFLALLLLGEEEGGDPEEE